MAICGYKTRYYEVMDVAGYISCDKMDKRIAQKYVKVVEYIEKDPYWCVPHAYKTKNEKLYLEAIKILQLKHDNNVIEKMIKHWENTYKYTFPSYSEKIEKKIETKIETSKPSLLRKYCCIT